MSGEDCWLLSASDGMEQPDSLFLVLCSIICPRLLLVSHEALPTMQQWLYWFCFGFLLLLLLLHFFLLIKMIGPCLSLYAWSEGTPIIISAWYTSDVFPVSAFWTGERKWLGAVFIQLKINATCFSKSKHGHNIKVQVLAKNPFPLGLVFKVYIKAYMKL